MKITELKLRRVEGRMPAELDRCDLAQGQRHRVPADVAIGYGAPYAKIRDRVLNPDGTVTKKAVFLLIETDEGITGCAGPLLVTAPEAAFAPFLPLLRGADPFDTARLWQLMYRSSVAPGPNELKAISAIDIALWDIRCKAAELPLHRMLGGKVQARLPVYASSVAQAFVDGDYDLSLVSDYVKELRSKGIHGSKWWIHRGPSDGVRGVDDMEALVKTIRAAGGPEHRIMIDCWCGWTYEYAMEVCRRISAYDIFFLEEPLLPTQADAAARLSRECPVRLSLGEHLLGAYEFRQHIALGFRGVFQPDPCWCGGITEFNRIMGLLSAHDYPVCPHASSVALCTQLSASYPISTVPLSEYIVNMADRSQWFLKYPVRPVDGFLLPGEAPGCQMDIDEAKVERDSVTLL